MSTEEKVEEKTSPKINKTATVRNLLKDIGAISSNPPEGWRHMVEKALQEQNLSMHSNTIYQIRNTLMGESKESPVKSKKLGRPKSVATDVKKNLSKSEPESSFPKLNIADLESLKEISKKFGGLDGLINAVKVIKSFKS